MKVYCNEETNVWQFNMELNVYYFTRVLFVCLYLFFCLSVCLDLSVCLSLFLNFRDGPDPVGGGGGGVERICKKKHCRAPKGHKKNLHTQHCEKKNCNTYQYVVVIVQSILFE